MERHTIRMDSAHTACADETLYTIVRRLDGALMPSLRAMRETARALANPGDDPDSTRSAPLATVAELCDDLLGLAEGFLDAARRTLGPMELAPRPATLDPVRAARDDEHAVR
jgi:hypothetical protein